MNLRKLYSLIWDQAAPALRAKLQTYKVFQNVNSKSDSLSLLAMIRAIYFSDSDTKYKFQSVYEIICKFYFFKQERNMPNSTYFEKYNNLLKVLRNQGVDLGYEPGTLKSELNAIDRPSRRDY